MSVLMAARTLGEVCAWRLTNLEMQKVLYVAQMLHLGRTGEPLFREYFEAWDYGPVVPRLYRHNRNHGRNAIPPFYTCEAFANGCTERLAIEDAYAMIGHMTPSQLVAYTHRQGGAWEKHYRPGTGSCVIHNSDILDEFQKVMKPSDEAVSWAEQMADEIAATPARYLDHSDERAFRTRVLAAHLH